MNKISLSVLVVSLGIIPWVIHCSQKLTLYVYKKIREIQLTHKVNAISLNCANTVDSAHDRSPSSLYKTHKYPTVCAYLLSLVLSFSVPLSR